MEEAGLKIYALTMPKISALRISLSEVEAQLLERCLQRILVNYLIILLQVRVILVIAVENLFHSNFLIVPFFCECIYRRRLKHKAQLLKRLPLDLRK